MGEQLDNWKTQIRKGYLELCILLIIQKVGRIYGFDLIERLALLDLNLKEGTLYPLLNRMTADGSLHAVWETENLKGHPRKFYSLTNSGTDLLNRMKAEYEKMNDIYFKVQSKKEQDHDHGTTT